MIDLKWSNKEFQAKQLVFDHEHDYIIVPLQDLKIIEESLPLNCSTDFLVSKKETPD